MSGKGAKAGSTPAAAAPAAKGGNYLVSGFHKYLKETPGKIKAIDSFLAFCMFTGIFQFVYCIVVGPFPFNSFLAGFLSTVGTFVLTVALRMQSTEREEFAESKPKRAFADYLLCNAILHLWVLNFMG
eukprot:comp24550_c0_seq1/m.46770 comp24550_c0_seq1/g.46770  ORF comp24550_c0_seq1/g.46770 comp24550_c0_seq1/m.46770 type:complete len:128 (-) comp24550_c0_seq1:224-607(-)